MKKRPILLILTLLITVSVCYCSPNEFSLPSNINNTNNDTLEKRVLVEYNNKMIYPIYVYGSLVLREPAINITKEFLGLGELIKDMFATMYESEGVGLAAPQIGESIRVFTIAVPLDTLNEQEPEYLVKVFVNPTIYAYSEGVCGAVEGCLSLPGLSGEVVRPQSIRVKYCDENFVEYDEEFTGFTARVIQHEYDHLEGVVYTDRVSSDLKVAMSGALDSMSRGVFVAEYETKQCDR